MSSENFDIATVEEIHVLPEMSKDESLDGYVYPEEFRNNLYIYKDQYIYIKTNTYECISKSLLDNVLNLLFSAKLSDFQSIESNRSNSDEISQELEHKYNSHFEEFIGNMNAYIDKIKEDFDKILIESPSKEMYQELNEKIENLPSIESSSQEVNISTIIDQILSDNRIQKIQESNDKKVSLGTLILLKENNYSVEEIKYLKNNGFI